MSRRVLPLVLACSLFGSLFAGTQPTTKVRRIGFLWNASAALTGHLLEAFRQGLHERGYGEGTHFVLEHRYAAGQPLGKIPTIGIPQPGSASYDWETARAPEIDHCHAIGSRMRGCPYPCKWPERV